MKYCLNLLMLILPMLFSCQSKSQLAAAVSANSAAFDHEDASGVFNEITPNRSHITSSIASATEPGERIKIAGIVYESDGKTPAKNVQMYFYHTNANGVYAKRGDEPGNSYAWWHGYNRGVLTTNDKGEYEINTIKPAPYPARVEPAHIHVIVKAPAQKQAYHLGVITFKGDELATVQYWYNVEQNGHPRDGGTALNREGSVLHGKKDYVLYAQYDTGSSNSGLLIGEECPAFTSHHVFGHDKGSTACPMCKYGYKQGVMAWMNTDDFSEMKKLAVFLEKKISENGLQNMRAFIIYMNPGKLASAEMNSKLTQLAKDAQLQNVALMSIPSPHDNKSSVLYRLNTNSAIRNTVFVYNKRRVADKFINLGTTPEELDMLFNSVRKWIVK
jgi:protocatechuate 3,4-dioxygenase beta subunit